MRVGRIISLILFSFYIISGDAAYAEEYPALPTGQGDPVFPIAINITRGWMYAPWIKTRIGCVPGSSAVNTLLTLSNTITVITDTPRALANRVEDDVLLSSVDLNLSDPNDEDRIFVSVGRENIFAGMRPAAFVGFGPNSQLIAEAEAAAIVDKQFIVGESLESFLESCADGIAFNISFSSTNGTYGYLRGSFGDDSEAHEIAIGSTDWEDLIALNVPSFILTDIEEKMVLAGAVKTPNYEVIYPEMDFKYRNCDRERLMSVLPMITISFYTNSTKPWRSYSYPEDYLQFDHGECYLKVRPAEKTDGSSFYRFNPLLVANLNLRITKSSIMFCDAV